MTHGRGRVRRRRPRPKAGRLFACCLLAACAALAAPARSRPRATTMKTMTTGYVSLLEAAEFPQPGGWFFAQTTRAGVKTDKRVYREPPLPALPAAGGKYIDAVFGTTIMRVTDERDCPAPGCGTWYSHWPTFNADNTLLLIRRGVSGDAIIKRFDPSRFELGATVRAQAPTLPKGVTLEWQGATWSATDPDLVYVHVNGYSKDYPSTGMKLYSYRVSSGAFKLLKDFAPEVAPGKPDFLFEMHVDAQDNVFTFMHKRTGGGGEPLSFIVWSRKQDKVLADVPNDFGVNACYPDKTGRYVAFMLNGTTAGRPRVRILDLQTGRWETLLWNAADDPPTHGDVGRGFMVGRSPWTGGISRRSLSDVHRKSYLFDMKDEKGVTDWSNDQHMTLYAENEDWVLVGTYDDPGEPSGETGAFEDEVMQVATDGSGRVRRLLHTRSRV
ncbi:MAG TPA: hypothetical protein VF297_31675, partial [Pyrinomonadaceae bacterium]